MFLQSLELIQFRNILRGEMEFSPRFNVISGPNGSGKSNILEALYLFFNGKSFRKARGRDMISWEKEWFRLLLQEKSLSHPRFLYYDQEKNYKYGIEQKEVAYSEFFLQICPFLLSREVFNLFYFSSGEIRRFFDMYLLIFDSGYRERILRFNRVLQERNALLKSRFFSVRELEIWDEYFVRYASEVSDARRRFIGEIDANLPQAFQKLFPSVDDAGIDYRSSFNEKDFFRAREEDRARGFTTVGPHRDRFLFRTKGKEMSAQASQGQMKSFVLSLFLTLLTLFNDRFSVKGILLLDDIFEELDPSRKKRILDEIIRSGCQVFFTMVQGKQPFGEEGRIFQIKEGIISDAAAL
ncbi:MAG TPA: DNA replication/repair protein RecF [Firmicutes bacterium]|nr:DNA replication/repair protein RecF [Bacillota bacterium]